MQCPSQDLTSGGGTPLPLKIGGVLESGGGVIGAYRGRIADSISQPMDFSMLLPHFA